MPTKSFLRTFLVAAFGFVMLALSVALVLAPTASATSKYRTLHKFKGKDGRLPHARLIFDSAGNLYGTTLDGGAYNFGAVFRLVPDGNGGWKENVLHSFNQNGSDGNYPGANLIFDPTGNLYCTTLGGGAYSRGTVFELTPNGDGSWVESVLYSFKNDGKDGISPIHGLVFDPRGGTLYGTTVSGGASGNGTVFQLSSNNDGSWTESVLHSFNGKDGADPEAGVILDITGNLYGTTESGGASGNGTIFQLSPNSDGSWTESVLHSFNGKDGRLANADLILDHAGSLFGTTAAGGKYDWGTVFQLTSNGEGSWTEAVLHSFKANGKSGSQPYAGLTFDREGNLFGTTVFGGAYAFGTVFKLELTTNGRWKESLVHSFRNHPGAFPSADLIFDAHGNIYGTTGGDSETSFGSVFEIIP